MIAPGGGERRCVCFFFPVSSVLRQCLWTHRHLWRLLPELFTRPLVQPTGRRGGRRPWTNAAREGEGFSRPQCSSEVFKCPLGCVPGLPTGSVWTRDSASAPPEVSTLFIPWGFLGLEQRASLPSCRWSQGQVGKDSLVDYRSQRNVIFFLDNKTGFMKDRNLL